MDIPSRLTEGSIPHHLYRQTIPMIGGIFAIMAMNIVDTFYVGMLGTQELAAMGFTIPVVSILLSLAFGIGIGVSSVISRAIGANNHQLVQAYCTQSLVIALFVALIFAVTGFNSIHEIFTTLGAPAELIPLIREFMDVWFLGSFIVIVPMVGNSAIRAAGNTLLPSTVMISVAIVNMALAPVLIFGLLGIPAMGLAGAALSTIIAYTIALIIGLYALVAKFDFISIKSCQNRIAKAWRDILKIAFPSVSTNLIAPLSVAIMTWFVAQYSEEAVAGLSIATRIEALFLVIIMALSSVMGPFVGQNWGAKKYQRAFSAVELSYKFVFFWGLLVTIILALYGKSLIQLFTQDPLAIESAINYLLIVPISYAFLGIIMLSSSTANGIGTPTPSLVMSLLRLLVFYVPFAYIGGILYGLKGIYASTTIANIIVGLGALHWYHKRKVIMLK